MALDYFDAECREEAGRLAYVNIASDILQDLDLIKVVSKLHITIDLDYPFFLAVGETKKLPPPVRVADFTNVMLSEGRVLIDVADETYLSDMLTVLWNKYGRYNVNQPDRFTITIDQEFANPQDVKDTIVCDQKDSLYKDLIYALQWIAPEGFKVRRECIDKHKFWYLASENTLEPEILDPLIIEKMKLISNNTETGGETAQ